MRVLILDSDVRYSQVLADYLGRTNYDVDHATTIADFDAVASPAVHSLYYLESRLPDGDGLELVSRLRRAGTTLPIMVVSSRTDTTERIRGLDAGADDYLCKPFSVNELLARTRALLRRPPLAASAQIKAGKLTFDFETGAFAIDGKPILLSPGERRLLSVLMRRLGRIVSRESLVISLQGAYSEATPNALDQQISRLRKTIVPNTMGVQLLTVRGSGYVLQECGVMGNA